MQRRLGLWIEPLKGIDMLLASVLGASCVTGVLLVAAVVWARNERYIARVQGWEIVFSLRDELVKTILLALVTSFVAWISVVFVANSPDDMPADFYMPAIGATLLAMLIYVGIVIWRAAVAQKVGTSNQALLRELSPYRRKGL